MTLFMDWEVFVNMNDSAEADDVDLSRVPRTHFFKKKLSARPTNRS